MKFAGFKVMNWFVNNSDEEIHIKGLARTLNISPATSKQYCDLFAKGEFLLNETKANLRLFKLNNDSAYVKEIKKTISLIILKENRIDKIADKSISMAIYGSFAIGEYNSKSDIDILVIGKKKDISEDLAVKIGKKLRRELQITTIGYPEWEEMKNKNDVFAKEILNKHILIKGAKL